MREWNGVLPWLRRNQNWVLTTVSIVGLASTVTSAVRNTRKAEELLRQREFEEERPLTKKESIFTVLPAYVPTIVMGGATVACIFGLGKVSTKRQMSLQSAYAILDQSYRRYQNKVDELYGDGSNERVINELARDSFVDRDDDHDEDDLIPLDMINDEDVIFFDRYSGLSFKSTTNKVYRAMYALNRKLGLVGFATLNDFYKMLGVEKVDGGDEVGWSDCMNSDMYWQQWVDFTIDEATMENLGRTVPCFILSTNMPPDESFNKY